jgi:hypothetical protein
MYSFSPWSFRLNDVPEGYDERNVILSLFIGCFGRREDSSRFAFGRIFVKSLLLIVFTIFVVCMFVIFGIEKYQEFPGNRWPKKCRYKKIRLVCLPDLYFSLVLHLNTLHIPIGHNKCIPNKLARINRDDTNPNCRYDDDDDDDHKWGKVYEFRQGTLSIGRHE